MTPTISDVASRAGVSVATVSRVLNGNYPVAEPTRARVMVAVRDLGYIANAHARALIKSTSGTVGVLLHDVSDPYFEEIVRGIQEVADQHGKLVVLCSSLRDPLREIAYIEMLRAQRVDAVILTSGYVEDDEFLTALHEQARGLRAQGSRLVLCGAYPIRAPAVIPDNAGGAFRITSHLLQLGHRRIAHLTGPPLFSTTEERLRGYQGALASFGLTPDPDLIVAGDFSRDGAYASCLQLLDLGIGFSAMFAANDIMAIGALAAFRERGVEVPRDISLVGFDDIPISRDLTPPLTTVAVPMAEIGRRAMQLTLDPLPIIEIPVRIPTEIVVRQSTLPVGARAH
jgi:LacI family transcriptional regulator, galactose operon repressor